MSSAPSAVPPAGETRRTGFLARFGSAAPWRLAGRTLHAFGLVPVSEVAARVPRDLRIVPVVPGRTLACFQLVHYDAPESVLRYHELIVNPALVAVGDARGLWTSHIYVSSEESLWWGRDLLGLPKERADFTWTRGAVSRFAVSQEGRPLFAATWSEPRIRWSMPLPRSGGIGSLSGRYLAFRMTSGRARRTGVTRVSIDIPAGSPLASVPRLGERPWALDTARIDYTWSAPAPVGR